MTDTTMNTGAASLSDEQREQLHLIERCDPSWLIRHIEEDTAYDGPLVARVFELAQERARSLLATPTPQADAAPTFEAWATKEGLISESHGVRFVNSMCAVARKAWDAAVAAGGAQEPVGHADVCPGSDGGFTMAVFKASDVPEGSPLYVAPLPREAATVAPSLLAADHRGMRVDYSGLFKQATGALTRGMKEPALAEMLRQLKDHLTELGQRWYAGDTAVVDELLQLYCVERDARIALADPAASNGEQA